MKKGKKHTLIIQGGGFKIAFTAGVLDAFLFAKHNPFDNYIAVSGGTVALSYYLSNQFRYCYEAMQYLAKDVQFTNFRRTLGNEGYMDIDFIKNVAEELVPFNFEKALKKGKKKPIHFVVTRRKTGNAEYFQPKSPKEWMDYAIASCTLPFVTKGKHKINGKTYFDGGWSDELPVEWAYNQGSRKILLLRTSPLNLRATQSWTDYFGSFYFREIPGLKKAFAHSHERYNAALDFIEKPPKDLEVQQITPEEVLQSGTYVYSLDTVKQDYRHGLDVGLRFLRYMES